MLAPSADSSSSGNFKLYRFSRAPRAKRRDIISMRIQHRRGNVNNSETRWRLTFTLLWRTTGGWENNEKDFKREDKTRWQRRELFLVCTEKGNLLSSLELLLLSHSTEKNTRANSDSHKKKVSKKKRTHTRCRSDSSLLRICDVKMCSLLAQTRPTLGWALVFVCFLDWNPVIRELRLLYVIRRRYVAQTNEFSLVATTSLLYFLSVCCLPHL